MYVSLLSSVFVSSTCLSLFFCPFFFLQSTKRPNQMPGKGGCQMRNNLFVSRSKVITNADAGKYQCVFLAKRWLTINQMGIPFPLEMPVFWKFYKRKAIYQFSGNFKSFWKNLTAMIRIFVPWRIVWTFELGKTKWKKI